MNDPFRNALPSAKYPPGSPYAPGSTDNPYAAPQAATMGAGPTGSGHAPAVKWVYALFYFAEIAAMIYAQANGAYDQSDSSPFGSSSSVDDKLSLVLMVGGVALMMSITGLVWLGMSWSAVPPGYRTTRAGKTMTPGSAVGLMLIPCFQLYWMFIANIGLCDAVDYLLDYYRSARRSPRGLATAACVAHIAASFGGLISPFFGLLPPILWFFYMFQMDEAKKEMIGFLQRDGLAPG